MFFFVLYTDDECFYVGLGHGRRGGNSESEDYLPFKCCATKLDKTVKVPKLIAQKVHESQSDDDDVGFKFNTKAQEQQKQQQQRKAATAAALKAPQMKAATKAVHKEKKVATPVVSSSVSGSGKASYGGGDVESNKPKVREFNKKDTKEKIKEKDSNDKKGSKGKNNNNNNKDKEEKEKGFLGIGNIGWW